MYLVFTIIWQVIIFLFSAQTASQSSNTSNKFIEAILDIILPRISDFKLQQLTEQLTFVVRKSAHFFIYFVLGILMYKSIEKCRILKNKIFLSGLFCLLYSLTDELHQHFVPGRSCQLFDVFIDGLGSISGILFIVFITYLFDKRNKINTPYV